MMSESTDLSFGTVLADRYELIGEVGRGGFGMVYRARQLNISREVAVKVLPPKFMAIPDLVARFQREAQLASRLRHPNTITIHDYGQHDNLLFIVMELLTGEDLADRLRRVKRLELSEIVVIARQVLKSLQEAHDQGIVHRDLKPENIFLARVGDDQDFVKVLDFGIAKIAAPKMGSPAEGPQRQLTIAGSTVGTPTYMSPEQAAGEDVDAQTDLYALGVILYEMANGRPPFADSNPVKTMRSHLFDEIPPFSNQGLRNTRFEAMVLKALDKDREKRFGSAAEFLKSLDEDLLSTTPQATEEPPTIEMTPIDSDLSTPGPLDNQAPVRDGIDALLSDFPPFSLNKTPAGPPKGAADAIPFVPSAGKPRQPVLQGVSRSNLTETSDLGLALDRSPDLHAPPPGFDLKTAASTSSILTVVEEPRISDSDVIVLTSPKRPGLKTPEPQKSVVMEPASDFETIKEATGEWVWGHDAVSADIDIDSSQDLLFGKSGSKSTTTPVILLLLFFVALIASGLAWSMGLLPF
jgi:serine/threonine protein kinase